MKTGALITCALMCGGILAKCDLSLLETLGHAMGMAYQLVDDLLDGDGAVTTFGRHGVEDKIDHLDRQIDTLLTSYEGDVKPLREIATRMIHRTA